MNTTDSAVRITHIPTGIVVSQQDEKSQHKNRAKAMKILRARLYDAERARVESERAAARKGQVGSGDRSERIRTYNFPQGRVTDHRINLTLYKLDRVMAGEALDEVIDALVSEDQAQRLAEEADCAIYTKLNRWSLTMQLDPAKTYKDIEARHILRPLSAVLQQAGSCQC